MLPLCGLSSAVLSLVSAVNKAVKPRVVGASSVPGLLSMLQVMPLTQLVTSQR
jgi:hypothetical protein